MGKYDTPLTKEENARYLSWLAKISKEKGRDVSLDEGDYDVRGYWKNVPDKSGGHGPDTYKKPNHPTFSDESVYHSEETPGGHWGENTFTPSEKMVGESGRWESLKKYMKEREPGVKLMYPMRKSHQ